MYFVVRELDNKILKQCTGVTIPIHPATKSSPNAANGLVKKEVKYAPWHTHAASARSDASCCLVQSQACFLNHTAGEATQAAYESHLAQVL